MTIKKIHVLILFCLLVLLAGCDGFRGITSERFYDGNLGQKIGGVEITFTSEDGSVTKNVVSDENGSYKISLNEGRYRVTATHPDYHQYSSAPGFFVVTGSGYQTGNIFLKRKRLDLVLVSNSSLQENDSFNRALTRYLTAARVRGGIHAAYIILDSQRCEEKYGVRVSDPTDWQDIRPVLRTITLQTQASSILLLGGPNVVPRPVIDVPKHGGPVTVSNDAWYVDFDEDALVDEGLCVSRMPDVGYQTSKITSALQAARAVHNAGGYKLDKYAGFSLNPEDYQTPPYGVCDSCDKQDEFFELLSTNNFIKFTGHGTPEGFYNNSNDMKFSIDYMNEIDLQANHPVIIGFFSCNTGILYAGQPTLSTEFLKSGASIFLARTTTNGIPNYFGENYQSAISSGEPIGLAVFGLMRESVEHHGDDFKVSAGHIVLYGDPTLKIQAE